MTSVYTYVSSVVWRQIKIVIFEVILGLALKHLPIYQLLASYLLLIAIYLNHSYAFKVIKLDVQL